MAEPLGARAVDLPGAGPERPESHLRLLPPPEAILSPWQEERERALEYARRGPEEADDGTAIDPGSLTLGGIATAFTKLVLLRAPEELKPPGERDLEVTSDLLAQSDRLLDLLPASRLPGVILTAYDL